MPTSGSCDNWIEALTPHPPEYEPLQAAAFIGWRRTVEDSAPWSKELNLAEFQLLNRKVSLHLPRQNHVITTERKCERMMLQTLTWTGRMQDWVIGSESFVSIACGGPHMYPNTQTAKAGWSQIPKFKVSSLVSAIKVHYILWWGNHILHSEHEEFLRKTIRRCSSFSLQMEMSAVVWLCHYLAIVSFC